MRECSKGVEKPWVKIDLTEEQIDDPGYVSFSPNPEKGYYFDPKGKKRYPISFTDFGLLANCFVSAALKAQMEKNGSHSTDMLGFINVPDCNRMMRMAVA